MDKVIKKNAINCFKAKYKLKEDNRKKLQIMGKSFIRNNRNNCKIIYKNKIYELKEYFEDIYNNYHHKDIVKIKLLFIHNNIDMSNMFYNCDSLISLSVLTQMNRTILCFPICITNMSRMFYGCKSLKILPDISKWNTSNVVDMSYMFYGCKSLMLVTNISKLNTFNVRNIENIFGDNFTLNLPENYISNLYKNNT